MEDISPLFAVEAEELLEEGKLEDAIELCKKGIEAYPDYPSAYTILASAANRLKNYDLSLEYLKKALDEFPGNKVIKGTYSKTEELAKNEIENEPPQTDEDIMIGTDKHTVSEEESAQEEENKLEEESKQHSEENTEDIREEKTELHEETAVEEENKTEEKTESEPEELETEIEQKKESEIIDEESGIIEEDSETKLQEDEEDIQEDKTELTKSNSESAHEAEDKVKSPEIDEINYNYTEPENLRAAEIDLIPGFKISSIEASNYDAGMKVKNYNRFLRSKMEVNTKDLPEDNPYSKIAENIKKSKIEPEKTAPKKEIENKNDPAAIVSDTMANIYYRQGAYMQALEIYKKLIEKNPSKKEEYEERISQINQKLEET